MSLDPIALETALAEAHRLGASSGQATQVLKIVAAYFGALDNGGLPEGFRHYAIRAERLEDMLETLVKACDASGVTQVPAGSSRPDLERLRAIIDSAKCLLP